MKKIDPTVWKETRYIFGITLVFSVIMEGIFLALGKWNASVLLGNLWGALGAVLNFFLMGLTVQNAVTKEEKEAKNLIRFSQSARMLMLFVIAGVGFLLPWFHTLAVVIPLLFPRIAIFLHPILRKD